MSEQRESIENHENTLDDILNQLESSTLTARKDDLGDFNPDSNIQSLLIRENSVKRLKSPHLTSPFRLNDRTIDMILRLGYKKIPLSAKYIYGVIHDLNVLEVEATVNAISIYSRVGMKTVRNALPLLSRYRLIIRKFAGKNKREFEYSIQSPNPHNSDFKQMMSKVDK